MPLYHFSDFNSVVSLQLLLNNACNMPECSFTTLVTLKRDTTHKTDRLHRLVQDQFLS